MLFREKIDDLAFGLVAPLKADDTRAGHANYLSRNLPERGWEEVRMDSPADRTGFRV
jgi:hypothetical protein